MQYFCKKKYPEKGFASSMPGRATDDIIELTASKVRRLVLKKTVFLRGRVR